MMNRMTKLYFNALFILFPVLFLFSSLLWKIVIRSYNVFEVITDTLCIIAIYYFLMSCIFIFLSNRISEDNKNIWKWNITAGLPRRRSFCIRWKLFNISWIASHTNLILDVPKKISQHKVQLLLNGIISIKQNDGNFCVLLKRWVWSEGGKKGFAFSADNFCFHHFLY